MTKNSLLRVAPGANGVSIWSSEIFGDAEATHLRAFLSRAFAVSEVQGVELRRAKAFGRIHYGAVSNPAQIWKKLSRALSVSEAARETSAQPSLALRPLDAGLVYLGGPQTRPVRVSRIGESLSTWRVRHQGDSTLRLWHPLLRNRRDVVFRLEEELAAIFGIEDFRASAVTAGVSIRFDAHTLTAERLAYQLEKAWPRLLEGLDGPPSRTRLAAAVGLAGLAFTGQYLVPALKPVAVAGVALYGAPNVVNAVKQLARGQVGVSALYSTGLAFMLIGGQPFASTLIAVLMQLWPRLARRKIVRSQRRLFAGPRRQPGWARLPPGEGSETEVSVDALRKGDLVVVRRGEVVPVDGVVQEGAAAVVAGALLGGDRIEDLSRGDVIAAGAFVHAGSLTIRVERAGAETAAGYIASLLPHGALVGLPSALEAQRIADRNARPALALSLLSLFLTRTLRPSQVLIRPDYVTAPGISAQLSTFHGIAEGLQRGVLFRNAAALDRLSHVEAVVIDDSAGLERRRVEVAELKTASGVSAELILGYLLVAEAHPASERREALVGHAAARQLAHPGAGPVRRDAGAARFEDSLGSVIEIATEEYLAASELEVPPSLQAAPAATPGGKSPARRAAAEPAADQAPPRPLWVLRDGAVIGRASFARTGEPVAARLVAALRDRDRQLRFVYLARGGASAAKSLAASLGLDEAHGDLSPAAKLDLVRGLGRPTLWLGDGGEPSAREAIAASTVSVSVAPLARVRGDAADVLLPEQGLDGVPGLLDLAHAHRARLVQDYRTVYAANLLGVTGAVAPRVVSLHVGLLSNLATGLVYARHAHGLRRLTARVEAQRARLTSAVSE